MTERDFRDYKKRKLSASSDGRGIKVAATASPGTFIHRALNSLAQNEWDEVWLRAVNTSGSAVKLTLEWGGTTAPDDQIEVTIPGEDGFHDVILGHVLQDGREVRAFAATGDVIVLHGFVNRYALAASNPLYWQRLIDVRPNHLIGYWRLNESSGTAAADSSGHDHDGTVSGAAWGAGGVGDGSTAASFDGVNDFIGVYSSSLVSMFNGQAGTLLLWGYRATWGASGVWAGRFVGGDYTDQIKIYDNNVNGPTFQYRANGVLKTTSLGSLPPNGSWQCLAMTWDKAADQFKAYVNGVQVGATQTGLGTWNPPLTVATLGYADGYWAGRLAHVALWNIALTADEIAVLGGL